MSAYETSSSALVLTSSSAPAYGQRSGWRPRSQEDFGDGGAFPEINVLQYPLDMGNKKASTSNALAIQVDAEGKIKYDAIARQGHSSKRIIHTSFAELIPLRQRANIGELNLSRPSDEEVADTTAKTKAAFDAIILGKTKEGQAKSLSDSKKAGDATYVRYTPSNMMGERGDVEHRQRIIKLVDLPEDPMAPPKFKHTKIPRGPPSPPAPIMHSPPRKLTAADQEAFNIPPSVSKWKNPKGYTIALDKRVAADGRGLEDTKINDNFAKFSEALYMADRHAREEVRQRSLMEQKILDKEKESREDRLRELARQAKEERERARPDDRRQRDYSPASDYSGDESRRSYSESPRSYSGESYRSDSSSLRRKNGNSRDDSLSPPRRRYDSETPPRRRVSRDRSWSRSDDDSDGYSFSEQRRNHDTPSRSRSRSRSPPQRRQRQRLDEDTPPRIKREDDTPPRRGQDYNTRPRRRPRSVEGKREDDDGVLKTEDFPPKRHYDDSPDRRGRYSGRGSSQTPSPPRRRRHDDDRSQSPDRRREYSRR
ncbi:SKIP/SNW domain-containing protein [Lipomyces japonicus]|uniref:SKIP/SNW domain-containing protein n=1 Tax=Lipomyces japonicus TaxID=56871 RepID=UPI0034CF1D7F